MQIPKALYTFYRCFWLTTNLLSVASCYGLYTQHSLFFAPAAFFFKLISNAIVGYLWYSLRAHELYFYHNLGLSSRVLFTVAMLIDVFLFFILLCITARVL